MFENLLGQPGFTERITSDITQGTLPRSLLFEGGNYSGKMTAALETARLLTCREKGSWGCRCSSCLSHRTLSYPHIQLLGTRYFLEEIRAAADLVNAHSAAGLRYMFIRNIRKMVKRFDPVLWEGEEKKLQKPFSSIQKINDLLDTVHPERGWPEGKPLDTFTRKIVKQCENAAASVPASIPIFQIRNISSWAHQTAADQRKFIFFENAELMQESAINALLKILEEPPQNLTIILLTSRRNKLIDTILSRVRSYSFPERSSADEGNVLKRIFKREAGEFDELRDFFQSYNDTDMKALKMQVSHFYQGVCHREPVYPLAGQAKMDRSHFKLWLEELVLYLQEQYRQDAEKGERKIPIRVLDKWKYELNKTREGAELYNQAPSLLLESLYYRMRDAV